MSRYFGTGKITALAALLCCALPGIASETSYQLRLELGLLWQERNNVQIPNDQQGDEFSLQDVAGSGPWASARLEGQWDITGKHGVRALVAPLSYSESGFLPKETRFAGETYRADTPVEAQYTFNSWRVGYRYHLYERDDWDFWVGGTLKVRDAKVELTQGDTTSKDDDIGVVPLLYLAAEYRFNDSLSVAVDFDGLAGGPGRAIDLGVRLNYRVNEQWQVGLGYRTLEGGADTDDVYSFAWFNSVVLATEYRF